MLGRGVGVSGGTGLITTSLPQAGVSRPGGRGGDDTRVPVLARPLASYYLLLFSAGLLLLLGLIMVLSASSVRAFEELGSPYAVFARQATWVGIGMPLLVLSSRLPVRVFRLLAYPTMIVSLVLLLVVLTPQFGKSLNGARRWIELGPYTLQPSEIAKLALVLWGADLLVRKRKLLGEWKHLLVPLVPGALLISVLIMLEPDMGTTIVVLTILLTLLWVVGTPLRVFAVINGVILLVGTVLAVREPYRLERLLSYRDPFADAHDTGFQAVQGLYALASGGWWGEGLGASREKWPGLLPNAHTDFILAIIGEELGLLGTLVVVMLFAVLGFAGIRVAHRSTDPFIQLAAAAATGWIIGQALVNMGAVVGLLPITGIPLPLVSFGGSALIPTMLTVGMLLSFARNEPAAAALISSRGAARRGARDREAADGHRGHRSGRDVSRTP
ncbi:putative lipid II flippase FtsW [Protofrankia symbiont of Coriaria ruscifolia]|uniref:Probable peptidoglycan glycosyltransferase FtsW n=1 Tax=Candidatus Protofrankia californiensis TaxID=1839754 RepID=A0A1C3P7M4_9ACTN|nr:putative lipid II flippase FtsW [Protofrankia symbiont of Coriaria ruscifolia]SBW25807.1 cell division protein FtsW [Candidatus Protofrankia californiensis]